MQIDWENSLQMRENNINELLTDNTKTKDEKIQTLKIWLKACSRSMADAAQLIYKDCIEQYSSSRKQFNLCEKALKELGWEKPKRKYRRFY
jgi:hypothetical protein